MTELELKLEVTPARKAQVLKALGMAKAPTMNLSAHYFDTPDGRLAASGLSLRLRREDGRWVQTLKALGDSPVRRLEDNVQVSACGDQEVPSIDLDRHRSKAAHRALAGSLKSHASPAWPALVERFLVTVSRRTRDVEADGEQFEMAFDEGAIEAHGQRRLVCEVELELKSGARCEHLFATAKRLVHDHHLWLNTLAKSSRGEALAFPSLHPNVARALDVKFDPDSDNGQALHAMVQNCLWQILPNASHVAAGSEDPDQIHQLRVGLRRLRTALREAGQLAGDVDPAWEAPLAKAFRQLGIHRDQASMPKTFRERLVAAGAPEVATASSWPPPVEAAVAPQVAVRDLDFQTTLLDVLAFSLRRAPPQSDQPQATRKLLRKKLGKLHRQVVSDGECFTDLPADEQHRVRKRLKRLRYLSEFARPLFKRKEVDRYLQRLRPAQDALGTHNDDAVALEGWRRHPPRDAGAWYAVGWLSANQVQTAQACRAALQKIGKAERFWAT